MSFANKNMFWATKLITSLQGAGVQHICISPGSRSTPLSLAAVAAQGLETTVHIDERAAAFFALGVARATGKPVALICTSGSASAHYHPAMIEAFYSRLPLIAITADRPIELMDCGAGQTITQPGMFGPHAIASVVLDVPQLDPLVIRHMRQTVSQAVYTACGAQGGRPGPVQVNVPLREPLEPTVVPGEVTEPALRAGDEPLLTLSESVRAPSAATVASLGERLACAKRPVVVVGPLAGHTLDAAAVFALAKRLGAPLLADPLSGLRFAPGAQAHTIAHYDVFMREAQWRQAHQPDLVLRFGMMPTSKVYRFWREAHPEAAEILVDPFGQLFEPVQRAQQLLCCDPGALISGLMTQELRAGRDDDARAQWMAAWTKAERLSAQVVAQALAQDETLWEGYIAAQLLASARPGQTVCIASSMPIRDVDAFGGVSDKPLKLYCSRGANGIDGLNATALGHAQVSQAPVLSLIGDVAFFHDVGALMGASSSKQPVTFVVINNAGGGIFSYLPIAQHQEHFERLFLTPPQAQISPIAQAYGLDYTLVQTRAQLVAALEAPPAKSRIIEVIVDREENVARHRRCWAALSLALTGAAP